MRAVRLSDEEMEMISRKARHGKPCTSCGLCCAVQLCDMATWAFKVPRAERHKRCPALEWVDGKSQCGLLVNPTNYPRGYAVGHETAVKAAALLIDPGSGCDMSTLGDHDAAYAKGRHDADQLRWPLIQWAAAVWGGRPPKSANHG